MLRILALAGLIPLLLTANPVLAANTKQKMDICKFGADNQQLKGAKRTAFIKRCMANEDYEPPARKGGEQPK